ncbi:MAG: flagellar motor switch protein FliM [Desulfobulbaceae bacterium]|nr:MAG: flagellar motor switch protein FliM [Desulfobulbaceae bacterium]
MEQVLTQDEVDALLKGIAGGDIEEPEEAFDPDAISITPYDFTLQQRIVQVKMPTLDAISDAFLRTVRNALSASLRRILDITPVPMKLERFGAFVRTLPLPASLQIFKMLPFRGHALIVLEPRLVFILVESFLGGSGTRSVRIEGRDFTTIEQRLIRRVVDLLLVQLEKAWHSLQPVQVRYIRSEINPQFAKICQPEDVVIINRYDVDMDRDIGSITTCIPLNNLESIKSKLATSFQHYQSDEDILIRRIITENIKNLETEIKVELGRTIVPAQFIINLAVGDTIQLDRRTDEQLPVFVGGIRKYMAMPGVHRGKNAVQIKKKVLDQNRD